MEHPVEYLTTCCGIPAGIDAELAPICKALWAHAIHTQTCCQGTGDGDAYIDFPDIGEADRFAFLVFDPGREGDKAFLWQVREWKWSLSFRLPLTQRALVTVSIPRRDLPQLGAWLAATPRRGLEVHPVAEPCPVSPTAGMRSTEVEERRYLRAAADA